MNRDGHTLSLRIDCGEVFGDLNCPFEGQYFVDGASAPSCRRVNEMPSPSRYCNAQEWWANGAMSDWLHTEGGQEFEVTTVPIPVEYWWEGHDGEEFYVRPYREATT